MTLQPVQRHSRRSARPSLSTHVSPGSGDAHDGWTDFLDAEGSSVESGLCHVLARFGAPLRGAADREAREATGDEGVDEPPPDSKPVGFPWVTLVVGSGCLSQPDDDQARELRTLPARLIVALGGLVEELGFDLDVVSIVREFTSSLIQQRVQELRGAHFPESAPHREVPEDEDEEAREQRLSDENDEVVAAHCVLAAALMHRAWHEGVAGANAVVRHRDELRLPRDAGAAADVRSGLLRPAADCLDEVVRRLKANRRSKLRSTLRSIEALAKRAHNQAQGNSPRLRGHDVDALVETAWLMLITPMGLYPGWRDLMTATALESSTHAKARAVDGAIDFARPRPPIVDLAQAGKLAASVASLQEATQRSWRDRTHAEMRAVSDRIAFYDALADVLVAQAGYGTDPQLVPATFVTSMDVELEMSLVRRLSALAAEDEDFDARFTVLVPYHFLYGPHDAPQRAMLYWLSATIDARGLDLGGEFDLGKADIRWRDAQDTLTKPQHGIVVVRLVGSPLMPNATMQTPLRNPSTGEGVRGSIKTLGARLRSLAAATSGTNDRQFHKDYPNESLLPAFMLDEYSGLHQMAAVVQGSLSSNLVDLGSDWIFRYWLCVGVQFDDVLVRLLLASHVDTSTGRRTLLEHHGVMVNRWVSTFDVDLLAWQGFDAVQSQFKDVTPDLHHYGAHMRFRDPDQPDPRDPEKTFTVADECDLGSVER